MKQTITALPFRPEDLPIWARLTLINLGGSFAKIVGWEYRNEKTITVQFFDGTEVNICKG